jgi:NAD(P)H-nitrite reductase large subunit
MNDTDDQNEIACYCANVSKQIIIRAVKSGANTLPQIRTVTGACVVGNCIKKNPRKRCCAKDIVGLIDEFKNT